MSAHKRTADASVGQLSSASTLADAGDGPWRDEARHPEIGALHHLEPEGGIEPDLMEVRAWRCWR